MYLLWKRSSARFHAARPQLNCNTGMEKQSTQGTHQKRIRKKSNKKLVVSGGLAGNQSKRRRRRRKESVSMEVSQPIMMATSANELSGSYTSNSSSTHNNNQASGRMILSNASLNEQEEALLLNSINELRLSRSSEIPDFLSDASSTFTNSGGTRAPFEIERSHIRNLHKVGSGSFGQVYRGVCHGEPVIVKVPKQNADALTASDREALRNEVEALSKIRHPHVILFKGVLSLDDSNTLCPVTELMYSDLERAIDERNSDALRPKLHVRLNIARQAALGMQWLHSMNIIHRDLKPSNILVNESLTLAKISDFGLASLRSQGIMISNGFTGTPVYLAPEVLLNQAYNKKVDVYSFALILWSLAAWKTEPFAFLQPAIDTLEQFISCVALQGQRPQLPTAGSKSCGEALHALITSCWQAEPHVRPSFPDIVEQLQICLAESALSSANGSLQFWLRHFYIETGDGLHELRISVKWEEFAKILLCNELGMPGTPEEELSFMRDIVCIYQSHDFRTSGSSSSGGKNVPTVTMTTFARVVDWFGVFYRVEDGTDEKDQRRRAIQVLANMQAVTNEPYFHGLIDRAEAEKRLLDRPDGSFLLRLSDTVDTRIYPFTLSMTDRRHVRIRRTENAGCFQLCFGCKKEFEKLSDLMSEACHYFKLQNACPRYRLVDPYKLASYNEVL